MEKKLVKRCETEVDGDACKASYLSKGTNKEKNKKIFYKFG